jgi:hypothetical protein
LFPTHTAFVLDEFIFKPKITVIKTFALPKLIRLPTSLPNLPQAKINDLNSLFYNFIWNGKSDKIKRSTLIGDIYQGGLKMIDFQSFNIDNMKL